MFEHSHLPNLGLTMGMIPPEIYQDLHKEIMDISNDDSNIVRANKTLAGFLTKEYQITKS